MRKKKSVSARRTAVQRRSRETVDAILTAAIRILATKSLAETTTTEIAERAGVSIGSLYEYFSDKQAIFLQIVEGKVESETERLISGLDNETKKMRNLPEIIRYLVTAYLDMYSDNEMLIRSFREVALDVRSVPGIIDRSDAAVAVRIEKILQNIRSKRVSKARVTASLMVRSIHAVVRFLTISKYGT